MSDAQTIRPGRGYYILAAALLAIGVAVFVWRIVSFAGTITDSAARVVVPGSHEISLAEPGRYMISYEYESQLDGRVYSGPMQMPPMECTLTHKATGKEVPLTSLGMRYTYELPSRRGVGVWGFETDTAADYVLAAGYPEGVGDQGQFVLAVAKRSMVRGILGMCLGIVVLVLCILGSLTVFIVTLVRRIGSAKRVRAASATGPPPSGPPPAPPMTGTG